MLEIGVDIDEVLYSFVDVARAWLQTEGYSHPMPPPVTWDIAEPWGMTRQEFVEACYRGVEAGFIFVHGPPLGGAVEGVRRLTKLGRVHLVTNRNFGPRTRENTLTWLTRWGIPYDSLTFAGNKAEEGPRCDVYVDDRPRNYDLLKAAGMRPYLMHHEWNRSHPGLRVYDMIEFANEVEELTYAKR